MIGAQRKRLLQRLAECQDAGGCEHSQYLDQPPDLAESGCASQKLCGSWTKAKACWVHRADFRPVESARLKRLIGFRSDFFAFCLVCHFI